MAQWLDQVGTTETPICRAPCVVTRCWAQDSIDWVELATWARMRHSYTKKAYISLVYLGWARARALLALGLGMSMQYDLLKFTNLYNTDYHSTKVSWGRSSTHSVHISIQFSQWKKSGHQLHLHVLECLTFQLHVNALIILHFESYSTLLEILYSKEQKRDALEKIGFHSN